MGRKFGNPLRRKVKVVTETVTRTVHVNPNSSDYAKIEDVVRGLGRQYVALSREIEPLVGKSYGREYFFASIGRMDQIARTIAMLTGKDTAAVVFGLDNERVYNTHGEPIDLELDENFDPFNVARNRTVMVAAR